jgi:hypothetical protein
MVSLEVNRAKIESVPQGGFYVRRNIASCILSASKYFPYPEKLALRGKTLPKSAFFDQSRYLMACSTMYH